MEQAAARQAVLSTIAALRAQIATFHHLLVNDAAILTIALLNRVDVGGELLDLEFAPDLAKKLKANRLKLACAPEEIAAILVLFTGSCGNESVSALLAAPAIAERVAKVEGALKCTLLEKSQTQRWAMLPTKVAIGFCFHEPIGSRLPTMALEAVIGGVVKSDVRRLEDVHDEMSTSPLDPLSLSALAACIASVCVR